MPSKENTLNHPSQLNALSVNPFRRVSGAGAIRLAGSISEHPERPRWEGALNRYYYACGCDSSAKGLIIGMVAGIALAIVFYFLGTWGVGVSVGSALVIAFGGAIIGKVFGLFHAKGKLRRTIREIREQWQPEEMPESERWACG